jgi:hypothetical protein
MIAHTLASYKTVSTLSPRRERVRVRGMTGRLEDFPVIANQF